MTTKTRAVLNADADTSLADNTTRAIRPTHVRTIAKDLADSALLAEDFDTQLSSRIGASVQAHDDDLDAWAGKTAPSGAVVGTTDGQTLTSKTIDASLNTLSNFTTAMFATDVVDTDPTLSANSATRLVPQAAIVTYATNISAGMKWKDPVRFLATTGSLATDFENGDTADGLTVATGDRFIYQPIAAGISTPGATIGIYIAQASGAAVRATDADSSAEITNAVTLVTAGTYEGSQWICNTPAINLGVTSIAFVQTVLGGASNTAGTGLSQTGNQFDVDFASQAEALTGTDTVTVINPLRLKQRLRDDGYINPKVLGAVGDTVLATSVGTDDNQAFLDAIDEALEAIATGEPNRATIRVPSGNFRVTEPLLLNQFGMTLKGIERTATRLVIDHDDGPGVRFYRSGWACEDMTIIGSLDRQAEALDNTFTENTNIGLLVLGPTGSTANFGGKLNNVVSQGHPADGIVIVGSGVFSYLPEARSNKRHGMVIDAGRIVGLTGSDLVPQGFAQILLPRFASNGGHSFVAGHPSDNSTAFIARVCVYNLDAGGHATDAAARYEAANGFLHGEDIAVYSCGMQGISAGVGANWLVAGKAIKVIDQRSVNQALYTVDVESYAGIVTANVDIDIGRVIGAAQNPAVNIRSGVADFVVDAIARDDTNVTSIATTGKTALSRRGAVMDLRGGRLSATAFYGTSIGSIADDVCVRLTLSSAFKGTAEIWADLTTGRYAKIHFDASATPTVVLRSEATGVTVGTTALTTGTVTGVNGNLNIAVTNGFIYVKNRNNATHDYHFKLTSPTAGYITTITTL